MRKFTIILVCMVGALAAFAQQKMYLHKADHITLGAYVEQTDSIYFSNDSTTIFFQVGATLAQYPIAELDSLTFGPKSNIVYVIYHSNYVTIINPFAFEGVTVEVNGMDVVVNSAIDLKDIDYDLSGTTTDGSFKIYSDKRFNLLLHGVNITNPSGPAINIQSENKASVNLVDGAVNTLADGTIYSDATIGSNGLLEDQKAAFFSEGKLVFDGTGSLTIKGNGADKNALSSDDVIEINNGSIAVSSALKDGIHANDGLLIAGGTVQVTASGDAIDGSAGNITITGGTINTTSAVADTRAITCDSTLIISGGSLNLNVSGNQSKGLQSGQAMTLSGGTIVVNASGAVVLTALGSGLEPSYCSAIKSDATITINGATITIGSTGAGGKGISSDTDVEILSGSVTITTSGAGAKYTNSSGVIDSYNATCIKTDGNLNILGGTVIVSSSGTGGKGLTVDGALTIGDANNMPTINVNTTGTKFTVSGSGQNANYNEPKAINVDGAITINNGVTTISSNDDGMKSQTSITINNGTVAITKSVEGMESPFITVNGGKVNLVSSDDGFNATHGTGGESNDGSLLQINGGNVTINASNGDGLDSNGSIAMTGGVCSVHGPQSSPEVGIDYNGTFNISGGLLVVSGTNSNMTQGTSSTSAQYGVIAKTNSSIAANTLFHVQDASGNNIVTFKPVRSYYSVVFSSSSLASGSTYSIYTGGTSTGTNTDGLYSGGTYSGGTLRATFTIVNKVTTVSF